MIAWGLEFMEEWWWEGFGEMFYLKFVQGSNNAVKKTGMLSY